MDDSGSDSDEFEGDFVLNEDVEDLSDTLSDSSDAEAVREERRATDKELEIIEAIEAARTVPQSEGLHDALTKQLYRLYTEYMLPSYKVSSQKFYSRV